MNKKRVMLFAYDGTGLGHIMRLLKIASGFSKDVMILVVSGHNALPEIVRKNINYYKLPNFYEERNLGKSDREINSLRMSILWKLINEFVPDAFITDYLPLGKRCELYPIITKYPTKKYFILRSEIGGDSWMYNDVFSNRNLIFLERDYEKIYIASDSRIQDEAKYNWLPPSIRQKMVYSGCVTYHVTEEDVINTRKKYNAIEKKWVVCTIGGGKVGADYIKECVNIATKSERQDLIFDIVLGFYCPVELSVFDDLIVNKCNIRIHKSIKDMYLLNASADVVICTGAYNSLLEAMQGRKKTIISMSVLRAGIDNEQVNNIDCLSHYYDIRKISDIQELESVFLDSIASAPISKPNELNMNGIEFVSSDIENQL